MTDTFTYQNIDISS